MPAAKPAGDTAFAGSIPQRYEAHLVPLIFDDYARDLAARAAGFAPARVLEIAAGTGAVTRVLSAALPAGTPLIATDLNPAMLAEAARVGTPRPVEFRPADAMALPFADASFDLVVCQFGVMFFPDKPRAHAEVRRVLRPGGRYLFNVWDDLAHNDFPRLVHEAVARLHPDDPPRFLARTPYGYHDRAAIRGDVIAGGFTGGVSMETVAFRSRAGSAQIAAMAFCEGTPLRAEIEQRDPQGLAAATAAAAAAIAGTYGSGAVAAGIQAVVVTARK